MPAIIGSDNSFRRNRKCKFGEEKNLWFHTFLVDKRNITDICEGHLPRKQAIDKLSATTYWKGLSADKSKVEEMRKKALKAQEGDAMRLRNAKKRAREAVKLTKSLKAELEKDEKEMENCISDEKLAKEAVTLKTNKLTQEKLVLDEKKEKLDKAEKKEAELHAQYKNAVENAAPAFVELAEGSGSATGSAESSGSATGSAEGSGSGAAVDPVAQATGSAESWPPPKTGSTTVNDLIDKISDEKAIVKGLKKQVEATETKVNKLQQDVEDVTKAYQDAKGKLDAIEKKVKNNRSNLVLAEAELHAAEGVVSSENSLSKEKGASRKAASREVSANAIAEQQKKEDLEIRMRLEKAALVDLKMKSTIKHHLNKLKLVNDMLQRKAEVDETISKFMANATEYLKKNKDIVANHTKGVETLKEEVQNMTDAALNKKVEAEDAQKAAVAHSTAHAETPVENDKRVDEANNNVGVTKINYESIKESGKLNITMAETKLGKAQAVLEIAQRYLQSQQERAKKLMTEFIASEKQQRTLEKANAQNNNNEDKKIKKEEALLADQQKAADEKEAEAKTTLDNQVNDIANEATDAIKATEEKTALDEASANKLLQSKNNSANGNETEFEEQAKAAADKLTEDAKESEKLAQTESEKTGLSKLPNTTSSQVTDDNEMANKFKKYKSKFEMRASEVSKMINDTKLALQKIRKMKAAAENRTLFEPENQMAPMVVSECTESEKILETQLANLRDLHKQRMDASKDMHSRMEKQLAIPSATGAAAAAPTLEEADPNVGAVNVD
jgi:hypothetical protein